MNIKTIYLLLFFILPVSTFAQHDPGRNAVRLLAKGKIDAAIDIVNKEPKRKNSPIGDAERYFVLSMAACQRGDMHTSFKHSKQAVELGLPTERFWAGSSDVFASLFAYSEFKKWIKTQPKQLLHGPLLGAVTDSSARFWVRTAEETDVRITKDGHFVSVHNDEVDKYVLEDNPGLVADMTLAELKQLDIGSRNGPEWKDTRIPTFEEILDLCKGKCGIYLDLKQAPVKPLIEMIKARDMVNDVIWYADDDELEEVKRICQECIIMPDPGKEKYLPKLIKRFHPDVVSASWKNISEGFVKTCHDAGAIVIVDGKGPKTWEPAIEWGMDGIQTDQPAALIELLKKRIVNK